MKRLPNQKALLSPAENRRAEQNRKKLKASEATVLAFLLKQIRAVEAEARRKGWSAHKTSLAIAMALRGALIAARKLARMAGRERLVAEIAAINAGIELTRTVAPQTLASDFARADAVSTKFAARWYKKSVALQSAPQIVSFDAPDELEDIADDSDEEPTRPETPVALATTALIGSIERIAATENAQAFNAEREIAARELAAAPSRNGEWMKVWDALLDVKTCPICRSADGTIVSLTQAFPLGMPGDVHPYCRCDWSLILVET
jgi:hypothetical protein